MSRQDKIVMGFTIRYLMGLVALLALVFGIVQAPPVEVAQAELHIHSTAVTSLPVVEVRTLCPNGTYGYMQGWFQASGSSRRASRGGFRADTRWNIKTIQVIGYNAARGWASWPLTFGSAQNKASQYTPAATGWGARADVSVLVSIVFSDGTKCIANIPSN